MSDYLNSQNTRLMDPATPGLLDGDTVTLANGAKFVLVSGSWEPLGLGSASKQQLVTASSSGPGMEFQKNFRKSVLQYRTNVHAFMPTSRLFTVANDATGSTHRAAWALKSKPYRVQAVIGNNSSAGTFTVSGVKFACSASLTDALQPENSGQWVTDGAGAFTIPAAVVTDAQPAWGWSGVVDVEGVECTGHPGIYLLVASAFVAAAQTTFHGNYVANSWKETQQSYESGLWWATRYQVGDKHTDPATFTATTKSSRGCIMGFRVWCEDGAVVWLGVGDSIMHGSGGINDGESEIWKVLRDRNLSGERNCYINAGWGGQNTTNYTARADVVIPLFKPDFVIYQLGTPNNGAPNAAAVLLEKRHMLGMLETAFANAVRGVVLRGQPPTSHASNVWSAADDNGRKALNAWGGSREIAPHIVYAGGLTRLGTGSTAVQENYLPEFTTDLNHPNDAGYAVAYPYTRAAMAKLLPE